jgi:hypothetical protein
VKARSPAGWPACVLLLLLPLAGCNGTPSVALATPTASLAPTWTPAPSPSATAIPPGSAPTPTSFPAGWQVYAAQHFSIAYPGDWIVQIAPNSEGVTNYEFQSTNGIGSVQVYEVDHVDAASISTICTSSEEKVTFAGLAMLYLVGNSGHSLSWEYLDSNASDYLLQTTDESTDPGVQASDTSILATFRAADSTPGCQ